MAAFTSLALGLGAASLGMGIYGNIKGQQKQEEALEQQQAAYAEQARIAKIQSGIHKEQAAASVDFAEREFNINQADVQNTLAASQQSYGIQQNIIAAERGVQEQQRRAMELDGRRQQMEIIRNQQRARALALTGATAQGAAQGSGLQGGYGQISGITGTNMLGVSQALDIGRSIFGLNQNISDQRVASMDLEYQLAQQRAASQTQKAQLSFDYAKSNAAFQTRLADTQTGMSNAQGQVYAAQGLYQQGTSQMQFGNSLMGAGFQLAGLVPTINNMLPTMQNYLNPNPVNVGSATSWSPGYGNFNAYGLY